MTSCVWIRLDEVTKPTRERLQPPKKKKGCKVCITLLIFLMMLTQIKCFASLTIVYIFLLTCHIHYWFPTICVCANFGATSGIFKFRLYIITNNFFKIMCDEKCKRNFRCTFNSSTFASKPHQLIRKTPYPIYPPQQWCWHTKSLHISFISISWLNKPIQFTTIMTMYLSAYSRYWWYAHRLKS